MSDDDMTARAREMVAETPKLPEIDVREKAGHHTGNPQTLDSRLFMQLYVYRVAREADPEALIAKLIEAFEAKSCPGVIYRDTNDPRGLGILTWSTEPAHFVTTIRSILLSPALSALTLDEDFTMLGRT